MNKTKKINNNIAQVIAITSGKGGVGKSTLATNLGLALAEAGHKVCLFDADTNLANINILLGITPLHTLEHFFKQNIALQDIIVKGPAEIDIISAASGVSDFIKLSRVQQQKLIEALQILEKNYQYLLIDTAAGIDSTNVNLLLSAPYLILVITQEPTSLTDAFSLLRVLLQQHFNRSVLVIVNMADNKRAAQSTFRRFKNAVSQYLHYKVYFAGHILNDKNMPKSILKQEPVILSSPDSPASQCILRISQRLDQAFSKQSIKNSGLSEHLAEVATPLPAGDPDSFNKSADSQANKDENSNFAAATMHEQDISSANGYKTGRSELSQMAEPLNSSVEFTEKSAMLRASYLARLAANIS